MKIIFQWTLGLLLGLLPWNAQGLDFTIQDLGTLTADESIATSINNQNVIVGQIKKIDGVNDFIWEQEKGLTLLPFPSTYQNPLLNNHNQLVGLFWLQTNYWFNTNTRSKHVYLWNAGSYEDLKTPKDWKIQKLEDWQKSSSWDEKELKILSFNDHQQILIANSNNLEKATRFAIWQDGVFTDIDSTILDRPYKINNQGQILGRKWIKTESGNVPILVLYHLKEGTTVEIMKDVNIMNRSLNDQGQVLVVQALKDQNLIKGMLWDPEQGLTNLDDFIPFVFNNCHQMVGVQISELKKENFVFLFWNNGEMINLNNAMKLHEIDSLWSNIVSIEGLNDNGYIIGQGLFDGKKHAFVLIPSDH